MKDPVDAMTASSDLNDVLGWRRLAGAGRCADPLDILEVQLDASLTPVTNHLECLGSYSYPVDQVDAQSRQQDARRRALANARIFDLGVALPDFYAAAAEVISNVHGLRVPTKPLPGVRYKDVVAEIAFFDGLFKLPAALLPRSPSKLPFESIFVAYAAHTYTPFGATVRLSNDKLWKQFSDLEWVGYPMGLLISAHEIVEYVILARKDDPSETMRHAHVLQWSRDSGWLKPQTAMPWVVTLIVDYLNSHNTLHHGKLDKKSQHSVMKSSKNFVGGSVRPRDYYTLVMRRATLQDSTAKLQRQLERRVHKYRVDVRGHESVRVMRGRLPLSAKDDKKLRDRGYRIYAGTEIDEADRDRLEHRDIAPRAPGEWIAVLSWWRESFQSPADPELPYVPAVRKPSEKVLR